MKKVLSLILALAMVFALAACGDSGKDGGVPDTIKIGVMGTMTGEQALDGDNIKG